MKQFSLSFFTRTIFGAPDRLKVFARLTISGKRVDFSIGRQIPLTQWSQGRLKGLCRAGSQHELRRYQDTLKDVFFQIERDLLEQGKALNPVTMLNAYRNRVKGSKNLEKRTTLLHAFEEHNKQSLAWLDQGQITRTTFLRYEVTKRRLTEFLKDRGEVFLEDVNVKFCHQFYEWMQMRKECGNNAIMKYIKNLRKVIRFSIMNGWIKADPTMGYKCRMNNVARPYLVKEELNSIEERSFELPRLETTRRLFLLACYTGLSYGDLISLKASNMSKDNEGRMWIRKPRQKTGQTSQIPLLPKAVDLISTLSKHPKAYKNGSLLPGISNQRLNSYLKEIGDMCGITKNLTFHVARHTFATTVTLANGVSLEAVSAFLGHSNIRQTQHYARMVDSRLGKEMDKVLINSHP